MPSQTPWWQTAVIYQVYPRSFQDTTADGVGDLPGILRRLDYLAALAIDAVWISPFYPSPMADFGYDVADYTGVDPLFGTLADFDALIAHAHTLGLKLILDFVPNHSSDQHPWFLESRSSRTNPKRDWYLWHDPAPGPDPASERPPNNWASHFGGSAWTFDPTTSQFYLHSFLAQQPDLNWRNPAVREAIFAAMRFWLNKGVDGFRMDVLWLLIKDDQFRDNPPNPDWRPGNSSYGQFLPLYTSDRPETHTIVAEMRTLLNSYSGNRLLVGEIYLPIADLVRYYGSSIPDPDPTSTNNLSSRPEAKPERRDPQLSSHITLTEAQSLIHPPTELSSRPEAQPRRRDPQPSTHNTLTEAQLPFNFHLIQTPWRAPELAALIRDYEAALPPGAWPNYVLGNHDQSRLATRIGPAQARVAAMLLLTLRGTPTLYYGDELGMTDGHIPPALVQDPAEKNQPGIGMGRDPERTPMLWDNAPNAGFTNAAKPWLPVAPGFAQQTVATEDTDPASMLTLYRKLLRLRRTHPALHLGEISAVASLNEAVLTYRRTLTPTTFQIFLNLTPTPQSLPCSLGEVLLSTAPIRALTHIANYIDLLPDEGLLVALDSD